MPQIKLPEDQTLRLEEAAGSVGHGWSFVLLCSAQALLYSGPTSSIDSMCLDKFA